jgi:hypothetical protein
MLFMGRHVQGYSVSYYQSTAHLVVATPYTLPLNFGVDELLFGKPMLDSRCWFKLDYMGIFYSNQKPEISMTMSGSDVVDIYINQIRQTNLIMVCVAVCPVGKFFGNGCEPCGDYLDKCSRCYASNECAECETGYVVKADKTGCSLCGSFMKNCVTCSSAEYCLTCTENAVMTTNHQACRICADYMTDCETCSSTSVCTSCYDGFVVNRGCSQVEGCIEVAQEYSGVGLASKCTACDTAHFEANPQNGVCICN